MKDVQPEQAAADRPADADHPAADRPADAAADRPGASRPRGPLLGLSGFLALLVALLAVSYTVGSFAGPVAPGLHPGDSRPADMPGGEDGGGMDMGGMDMEESR
ncbi:MULTISPECIES: hypothetical protein [Streptomyces]|uniref:hypothetical protein n=1 Tax=Streptomyces TaxID=1883 RepID=UPI000A621C1A|nr:hypothetical protein [Streptomyces changanensis]